jgi:hypothetical protein
MAQFVVMGLFPPPPIALKSLVSIMKVGLVFGPTRLINDLSIEDLGVFLIIKTKVFGLELCFESMVLNVPGLLL